MTNAARHTSRKRIASAVRLCACAVLVAACVVLLSSCRPTDFFTEVIISPFADKVDYDNPEQTIVNSPDATEESDQLAAVDWTDDAARSNEVQNIITYSDDPTTTLSAHHSIFDLDPRFLGVKSSDPVQLAFNINGPFEQSNNSNPTESNNTAQNTALEGLEALLTGTESAQGPSDTGSTTKNNDASGTQTSDATKDPYAGYDGNVNIYDPNNGKSKLNHADKIAACGQAAVLVQALGGQGALAAMDVDTYNGDADATTVSSFAEIFADELPEGFEDTCLLWDNEGISSDDVGDRIDAIIAACGEGGVIMYDQTEATATARFTEEMRKHLQAANIQLVPIDLSTVQGMIDAASAVSEILSESSEHSAFAKEKADAYCQTISTIIAQAAQSNGGNLAELGDTGDEARTLTTYNGSLPSKRTTNVYTAIATDYDQGITYSNAQYVIDSTQGVLFTELNEQSSPLFFWAQAAGVYEVSARDTNASSYKNTYAVIWGMSRGGELSSENPASYLAGNSKSEALVRCKALTTLKSLSTASSGIGTADGLGSASFPYLIVSSTDTMSGTDVKDSVVTQMRQSSSPLTPYSVLPWYELIGFSTPGIDLNGVHYESYIGASSAGNSVFYDQGVSISDSVRVNPAGLLGSWTSRSMESVLEAVWIARIYSAAPENSSYSPLCNYSKAQLEETVETFYETFYRVDEATAQQLYHTVVTDEGL